MTRTTPVRVEFTLGTDETTPGFELPVVLIDYTVTFNSADSLNPGDAYRTDTFASNGTFLGGSSYTNTGSGNIIGCACTGGPLVLPLDQPHFFMLLSSLSGTFDVTEVIALAYDCTNGCGEHARAFGQIHRIPEPMPLALILTCMGLVWLTFAARQHRPPKLSSSQYCGG